MRFTELRETLQPRMSGECKQFAGEELRTVLTLVERGFSLKGWREPAQGKLAEASVALGRAARCEGALKERR